VRSNPARDGSFLFLKYFFNFLLYNFKNILCASYVLDRGISNVRIDLPSQRVYVTATLRFGHNTQVQFFVAILF
jgi:hypothetical protein